MPDALGWRAKFGVLAPSTNTIVEPDFYHMGVPGVTSHFSRIHIRDPNLSDDAAMEALMVQVREETAQAVARVLTAEPTSPGSDSNGCKRGQITGWEISMWGFAISISKQISGVWL